MINIDELNSEGQDSQEEGKSEEKSYERWVTIKPKK